MFLLEGLSLLFIIHLLPIYWLFLESGLLDLLTSVVFREALLLLKSFVVCKCACVIVEEKIKAK